MGKRGTIIGVTGGLATGKTTVTDLFVERGAVRIDADAIAHDVLENDSEVKKKVIGLFGDAVTPGGSVDRRKLARIVFFDKEKLGKLCKITHPAIIKRIADRVQAAGDRVVVIDAPLLIESALNEEVDIVVVVTADLKTQIKRAVERGIGAEEAKNIIDNQMPLSRKEELADYIIDNDGNFEKIKEGVDRIWQKI